MPQDKKATKRLSEAKLSKFRQRLEKMREEVVEELSVETGKFKILLDEYRSNPGSSPDRPHPPYAENMLLTRKTRKLENIHKSLHRIELGSYGICVECDGPIDECRLVVRPTAPTCVDCESIAYKEAERNKKNMNCRGTIAGRRG